jgi:hypothetical protein
MKRSLAWVGLVVLAWAGSAWASEKPETLILNGLLVDNACVQAHTGDLMTYVRTHAKECALKPENVRSGYALITPDGEVTSFEDRSNARISAFLRQSKSKLSVTVTARLEGEKLMLISIQNLRKPRPAAGKPPGKP